MNNFKRVLKFAWTDFSRNRSNNFAAIFVLALPILLATSLFVFQGISEYIIYEVKGKMDVTAFFQQDVAESDILRVKDELIDLSPEIKSVTYVSKDQAMENFIARHQNDPDFSEALEEVGVNPFLSSLDIVTDDPLQYEKVAFFLEAGPYAQLIDKVDYSQKKDTIEKVFSITANVNRFGLVLGIILFLIAILVVLNTIKLSIDSSKDEITTMKLVGASDWFIRGPFIVQGIICGFAAFLICFVISVSLIFLLSPNIAFLTPGFTIAHYFTSHLLIVLLIQLGFGVGLGALASFILARSYLKV